MMGSRKDGRPEWTEVRRRRNQPYSKQRSITTYFVSNIPEDARKGEIRDTFAKYGEITDVYMGVNKGKNGKFYAFVRFTDVRDEFEMEKKLDGIMTPGVDDGTTTSLPAAPLLYHPPIILKKDTLMFNWLAKTTIVGEAISLIHLGHFKNLLFAKKETFCEIKYLGGLKVLLLFKDSIKAKEFVENEGRWRELLSWVKWGDKLDMQFEKVAWIWIVGLPLSLWGDRNFDAISGRYGKIIAPFDEVMHRVDLSHVKIGIITSRRARINEETSVVWEGRSFKVGIIEFDEDWFPFRWDSPDSLQGQKELESEDEDTDEEDGISDTCMGDDDIEVEEGEFCPEPKHMEEEVAFSNKEGLEENQDGVKGSPEKSTRSATIPDNHQSPETDNVSVVQETQQHDEGVDQPTRRMENEDNRHVHSAGNGKFNYSSSDAFNGESGPTNEIPYTPFGKKSLGFLDGLLPQGCFGPFPCPVVTFNTSPRAKLQCGWVSWKAKEK
ncbi:hypothetical protein L1887_23632 [Cichorium endivia]|nr:hypothetical protein L1887_23632 [Cichorium endivia]